MIGYRFMGKAHSNAWRQAPHFLPLKAHVELHTICGRDSHAKTRFRFYGPTEPFFDKTWKLPDYGGFCAYAYWREVTGS